MNLCEYVNSSTILSENMDGGSFGLISLWKGPDGRQFITKRIPDHTIRRHGLGLIIREINAMSILKDCPDIVKIYGTCFWVSEFEDQLNLEIDIVMEPMDGNLIELTLAPNDIPNLLSSLLRALASLNSLDMIHNDISEGNILWVATPSGMQFKLGDFGLVRKNKIRTFNDNFGLALIIREHNSTDPWVVQVLNKLSSESYKACDIVTPTSIVRSEYDMDTRWANILQRELNDEEKQVVKVVHDVIHNNVDEVDINLFSTIGRLIYDLDGQLVY